MQTIQASKFKAQCLALMDQVAATGRTLLITKNGKPIAELHPHAPPRAKSLIGLHKNSLGIVGDIVAPIDVVWDVLKPTSARQTLTASTAAPMPRQRVRRGAKRSK